jgi:glutamate synthase (NADPH/NADH) large chain
MRIDFPKQQGLYDRAYEHDSCGIGFVANIKGERSNDIVQRGLEALERMAHRGAESADNKTGDGAGILLQIPHAFYKEQIPALPEPGTYGTGIVFLPQIPDEADVCCNALSEVTAQEGLHIIAWRKIEVDHSDIGKIAQASEPIMMQVFMTSPAGLTGEALERKLLVVRKQVEFTIRASGLKQKHLFYVVSLSTKTIIYKGMLMSKQLRGYFADLQDRRMASAIALVHSRFSTNTFPSWDLAQPFRMLAHNGEINTIKGNRFWIQTASAFFESELFGDDIKKLLPVVEPGKSDSASLDNVLELLVAAGRSVPHALMMLVPESFNKYNPIPEDLKYFYEYHSAFMEPWDGPASLVFCDGRIVGGTLDRNGLRPSRYVVTKDGLIVMASEVGVQTFPPELIEAKGRLRPGKLLLVDTEEGRIIPDAEMKQRISTQRPYHDWVETYRIRMDDIPIKRKQTVRLPEQQLIELENLYNYTREDLEKIILPTVTGGEEPVGSMGNDTPLAVFSDRPQLIFNYFKQVFAQVTNPAIDSYREEMVMTLTNYIGSEGNILSEEPENCRMIQFKRPIFTNNEIAKLIDWDDPHFPAVTLNMTFPVAEGEAGLERALDQLCLDVEREIDDGYPIIILTDKGANVDNAPIPSLLACAGVHHHLVRVQKRTKAALIIQTAEAREVMHFALLFGYGASVINPYGAFAVINGLFEEGRLPATFTNYRKAEEAYIHAIDKGVLKVLSKLGISTLRSYHGAQTFEAIGLSKAVTDKYFTGTDSRIGGIGLREIAREKLILHHRAYVEKPELLDVGGNYQWRKDGEKHAWNPDTIHLLQYAVRTNDYDKYKKFSNLVNAQNQRPHVIRGLFEFVERTPIAIDEVEPAENIFKRLTTGAMSFGSISKVAHETIAIAMNAIGGRSNSGEGGEDPERFKTRPDGTSTRSKIKQIASARFGVTSNYLVNADELQIKVAQGAKPGEGGQLPGTKVDKYIAKTRHATPGVTLISPPPHHDIYSIEDLAQLIFDLKNGNPDARVSVKLVSESGVGTVAAGVAKAHADLIIICGYDGGTGASPQSSIKHAGLPFELGISETHQTLVMNGLRGRVRLQTDGQLKTGRDIVLAGILGAEEFAFGTASLISLGCIMMRKCHLNTCPVGVATHDPELTQRFTGEPEHLIRYFTFMVQEIREIMAQLGIRKFNDLIGRTDLLMQRETDHWKARTVDLSAILYRPPEADTEATYCVESQIHKIDDVLDRKLIQMADAALKYQTPIKLEMPITNADRAVGAMLSSRISRLCGEEGFPDNTIECTFTGSAGQSFGAFTAKGVTFKLIGDANDYLGKSLSGGRLVVVPPPESTFKADENIIIGNTVLYGATSGEVYVRGVAGERFCVRNSGAFAVVEGAGDHCGEYMTGGRLIVLGKVGRNFAAGMSGGIAYVLNVDGNFAYFCNTQMVELSPAFEPDDQAFIREYVTRHLQYTGSTIAKTVLDNWHEYLPKFIRVMPIEYKRVLEEQKLEELNRKLAYVREEAELEEEF